MTPDFQGFGKIPRMTGFMQMVITEKLDGTNAQINITPDLDGDPNGELILQSGSKNRYIIPGDDNFAFAKWCAENRQDLINGLGEGRHFGEWCGPGIQKNKCELDERALFLFNTLRWHENNPNPLPCGVRVVPILYSGAFDSGKIDQVMHDLLHNGSSVGGMNPEGIIIYLPKSRQLFKRTFKYEEGKWGKE